MPMGPLRLIDEIGVRLSLSILVIRLRRHTERRDHVSCALLWLRSGRHCSAAKRGRWLYRYHAKTQNAQRTALEKMAQERTPHPLGFQTNQRRERRFHSSVIAFVFLMVNESRGAAWRRK